MTTMNPLIKRHISADVILPFFTVFGLFAGTLVGLLVGLAFPGHDLCEEFGAIVGLLLGLLVGLIKSADI